MHFCFLMIRRPPRSTLFPTRRSSDLTGVATSVCQTNIDDLLSESRVQRLIDLGVHYVWYHTYRPVGAHAHPEDRKSTRLNSSHANISYAVFCLKKKTYIMPSSSITPT